MLDGLGDDRIIEQYRTQNTRSLSSLLGSGFSKYCSRRASGYDAIYGENAPKNERIAGIKREIVVPGQKETANLILQSLILLPSEFPFKESDAIFLILSFVDNRIFGQGERGNPQHKKRAFYRRRKKLLLATCSFFLNCPNRRLVLSLNFGYATKQTDRFAHPGLHVSPLATSRFLLFLVLRLR